MTDAPQMPPQPNQRCGYVAIAGAPNVGKSTLLNRILGRPLSIATPKPQTTRRRLLGVETRGDVQIVFCDTPGIHPTRGLMHDRMNAEARQGVREADVVCWIVDAARGVRSIDRNETPGLVEGKTLIAINKCDAVAKGSVLPLIAEISKIVSGCEIYPVSARTGEGVDVLVEHLAARMPAGPWMYDPELFTDQSERYLVGELVREQLFLQLDAELPYRIAVVVDVFRDGPKHTSISATIFTDSDSTKRMIIGKGGARIKSVGIAARQNIEELLDRKVFLELFVKVKPGWQDDPRFLAEIGL
ncbi:MAG TPA: GTPase Era [Candidatus Limnocylindrales bacterium]|nr:GTPase Era [Candidatus Limnocylindrales bacterium]